MTERFYDGFKGWKALKKDFMINEAQPRFVFAFYDQEKYSGWSVVITSEDGESFRINDASHCSCYGLSECWSPTDGHSREAVKRIMDARIQAKPHRKDFRNWFKYLPQAEPDSDMPAL